MSTSDSENIPDSPTHPSDASEWYQGGPIPIHEIPIPEPLVTPIHKLDERNLEGLLKECAEARGASRSAYTSRLTFPEAKKLLQDAFIRIAAEVRGLLNISIYPYLHVYNRWELGEERLQEFAAVFSRERFTDVEAELLHPELSDFNFMILVEVAELCVFERNWKWRDWTLDMRKQYCRAFRSIISKQVFHMHEARLLECELGLAVNESWGPHGYGLEERPAEYTPVEEVKTIFIPQLLDPVESGPEPILDPEESSVAYRTVWSGEASHSWGN